MCLVSIISFYYKNYSHYIINHAYYPALSEKGRFFVRNPVVTTTQNLRYTQKSDISKFCMTVLSMSASVLI